MLGTASAPVRLLYRSSLVIFLVTIVIGILNGLDLWEPPREILLTHVHAGTLGWITLAIIGFAISMFEGDRGDDPGTLRLAQAAVGATVLYMVAFATGTGIFRPIAGTLELLAIVWALAWVIGRWRSAPRTIAGLSMMLAMVSLTIGAVLGVLLGLFIANGELPGMDAETAGSLAGAHPPAMLVGYLILAVMAVTEWQLAERPQASSESRSGLVMAVGLFLAGVAFNLAFILDIEALIQVATLLEVIGVVIFVVRMWGNVAPAAWKDASKAYPQLATVWLAAGVGLLVYLVQLFISGAVDPEAGEGTNILIAFDHTMFMGATTNALFGAVGAGALAAGTRRGVMYGVNVGLVVFVVGLLADSTALKMIGSPVMGFALLWGIYALLTAKADAAA
jgi:hypothetical protein